MLPRVPNPWCFQSWYWWELCDCFFWVSGALLGDWGCAFGYVQVHSSNKPLCTEFQWVSVLCSEQGYGSWMYGCDCWRLLRNSSMVILMKKRKANIYHQITILKGHPLFVYIDEFCSGDVLHIWRIYLSIRHLSGIYNCLLHQEQMKRYSCAFDSLGNHLTCQLIY